MEDYEVTQLDVPVPNEFWRIGSDALLVMLPGVGYTNQMPWMFYVHELAIARRWDVLQVNYDYRGMSGTTQEERVQRLTADCRTTLDAALAEGDHTEVVLVGKSLGSIVMASLLRTGIAQDLSMIWLTPLLRLPEVREAITANAGCSAVVIGTRDDHYDAEVIAEMEGQGAMVRVVDGGDHSLDIEGDVGASIGALREVINALDGYLER